MQIADLQNLLFRQPASAVAFAKSMIASVPRLSVPSIIFVCSKIQMLRIYAVRDIASMKNRLTCWDGTVCLLKRKPVRLHPPAILSNLAVTKQIGRTNPKVAVGERDSFNLPRKPFLDCLHVLTSGVVRHQKAAYRE